MTTIIDFFKDLGSTISSMGINDILEVLIMAYVLYKVIIWIRDTRTWTVLKGILAILIFFGLAKVLQLNTILYIAENSIDVIVLALIVVFQPELRNTLERIGKGKLISTIFIGENAARNAGFSVKVEDELIRTAYALGNAKTGALMVIEKGDSLDEYIKTGINVDAAISSQLLINIFEHNTPLHDGAVVIRGDRVVSATCYLPLSANNEISKSFGTRHRAALGVSEVTDSITIVCSEETGHVSVAIEGKLHENIEVDELRKILDTLLKTEKTKKKIIPWRLLGNERKDS